MDFEEMERLASAVVLGSVRALRAVVGFFLGYRFLHLVRMATHVAVLGFLLLMAFALLVCGALQVQEVSHKERCIWNLGVTEMTKREQAPHRPEVRAGAPIGFPDD